MNAGDLRHRIDIEEPVATQDEHGDPVVTWVPIFTDVPAAIAPISGREFLTSQGAVAQVTTRIAIRWRREFQRISSVMRVVHRVAYGSPPDYDTDTYNIVNVLPDKETGRDHLTLMCNRGVNEG